MGIYDIDTEDLMKEIERRRIVDSSVEMSRGNIEDGQWNVINFNFLLLNAELKNGELVAEVDEVILHGEYAYNAKYEHDEIGELEEVYIFDSYGSMMSGMGEMEYAIKDIIEESNSSKITIDVFEIFKDRLVKVICRGKAYIIVKL